MCFPETRQVKGRCKASIVWSNLWAAELAIATAGVLRDPKSKSAQIFTPVPSSELHYLQSWRVHQADDLLC